MITVKKDIKIPESNYVLEKGDRIEILKESDVQDAEIVVDLIDWDPLIKKISSLLGMKFKIEEVRVRKNQYIKVAGPYITGKDLGVFYAAVSSCRVETFNTELSSKDPIWWATWSLRYENKDGGSNGMNFLTTWYNYADNTWKFL